MHNETGLLVETRNPEALAAAILDLLEHPTKPSGWPLKRKNGCVRTIRTEHSLECLYQAYDAVAFDRTNAVAAQTL